MNAETIIKVLAIAVPNTIVLAKWYWEAKSKAIMPKPQPETNGTKKPKKPSRFFGFVLPILFNLAILVHASFQPAPLDGASVSLICFSVGACVLLVLLMFMFSLADHLADMSLSTHKSILEALLEQEKFLSQAILETSYAHTINEGRRSLSESANEPKA